MGFFCHPNAICESKAVGDDTRIWAFVHILPGAVIGEGCNICDFVLIENQVRIGNHVTIKSGVQLWDGVTVEDGVFIGPNATFTNDIYPPNRGRTGKFQPLSIKLCKCATIGANATILPDVEVGENAIVGAGAVVTRSVPPGTVVVGNPARVVAHVGEDKLPKKSPTMEKLAATGLPMRSELGLISLGNHAAGGGRIPLMDGPLGLPFNPAHIFVLTLDTKNGQKALPARTNGFRLLVSLGARMLVMVESESSQQTFELGGVSGMGLLIPPMTWTHFKECDDKSKVMIIDSLPYEPDRSSYDLTYEAFCFESPRFS